MTGCQRRDKWYWRTANYRNSAVKGKVDELVILLASRWNSPC